MKQEAADMMAQYVQEKLQQEDQMRRLVEIVMEGRDNAKEAKKRLQEYKANIGGTDSTCLFLA